MDDELNMDALIKKYEQMRTLGKKMYLDADEFAFLAQYYGELGDYKEAGLIIEEGLKMHPGSSELMLQYAKKLIYLEQYEEAYHYLSRIANEGDLELPLLKIESLLHLERYDEAAKIIDDIASENISQPDLYTFFTEIGYMYNDMNQYDRAIFFLEESLKIDPFDSDVLNELAYACEMKGDFEKAIAYINKLLDNDPYSLEGWINLGKLYSINEEYGKAVDAFDFALTINEKDVSVLKLKALSLYMNDNVGEAIRIFEECLRGSPNDESLYDSLLEGYEVMQQYDEMMKIIDRKEKKFGSKGILLKKAHVYIIQQNYAKAREIFEQIPDSEKNTWGYYLLEGDLAFYSEDFVAAETAYIKASMKSPDNENIIDRLANVSVAREKYEQAEEYLEQLLAIDPDYPAAKSKLAIVRFEIGAKEPFDEIINRFSDDELRLLLNFIIDNSADFSQYGRDQLLAQLHEARENRILFKNIKY